MVNVPFFTGFLYISGGKGFQPSADSTANFVHSEISTCFSSSWWQGWIAGIQGRDLLGHRIRGVADTHHLKEKQRGGRCGSAYLFLLSVFIYIGDSHPTVGRESLQGRYIHIYIYLEPN